MKRRLISLAHHQYWIIGSIVLSQLLLGCINREGINQPQQAEAKSIITANVKVIAAGDTEPDKTFTPYLGVNLPVGWKIVEPVEFVGDYNGALSYNEAKSEFVKAKRFKDGYYWWVGVAPGMKNVKRDEGATVTFKIQVDEQIGDFYLDYVMGIEETLFDVKDIPITIIVDSRYQDPDTGTSSDSYPPFNADCTEAEVAQYTRDFAQSDFARLALPACGPKAVPALISFVEDERSNVQCTAARALANMGEEAEAAIPALTALLKRDQCTNPHFYLAAIGKAAVPAFIEALGNEDEDIRIGAAIGLGEIGEDAREAVPALIEASTQEGSGFYYEIVAESLGGVGTDAEVVVPALIKLYEEKESEDAIDALAEFGPDAKDAIPSILRAFTNPRTQYAASRALGNIGKEAVPAIVTLLESNDAEVRANAAFALILVGKDAETAASALENAVQDEDPRVRARAAVALVQIDPEYAPSVSTQLISALEYGFDDQDRETQIRATLLLEHIGEEAIEAVPALIKIVQEGWFVDAEPVVKAIIALGTIADSGQGVQMGEAVTPLVELLGAERLPDNLQPRAEAALTLGKFGQEDGRVVPALIRASGDLDEEVRVNAQIALGMFGVNPRDVIPELLSQLDNEDVDVRRRAALSLAELGPYAVPSLLTALESGSPAARISAAYALGNIRFSTREMIEALQAIVLDESNDLELRRVAASSLELLGQDMQPFFEKNNLISPKNAACPSIPFGANRAVFEYDVLTGRCRFYWQTTFTAGGERLIEVLCSIFGC